MQNLQITYIRTFLNANSNFTYKFFSKNYDSHIHHTHWQGLIIIQNSIVYNSQFIIWNMTDSQTSYLSCFKFQWSIYPSNWHWMYVKFDILHSIFNGLFEPYLSRQSYFLTCYSIILSKFHKVPLMMSLPYFLAAVGSLQSFCRDLNPKKVARHECCMTYMIGPFFLAAKMACH